MSHESRSKGVVKEDTGGERGLSLRLWSLPGKEGRPYCHGKGKASESRKG